MDWYIALSFLLGMILFFMFLGVPVALAFLAANMVGATYFMGGSGDLLRQMSRGIGQLTNNALPTVTSFNLMPVPMFLLMGEIFFHTGLANKMSEARSLLSGLKEVNFVVLAEQNATEMSAVGAEILDTAGQQGIDSRRRVLHTMRHCGGLLVR